MQNAIITRQEIEYDFSAIQNDSNLSNRTKDQYIKALRNYLATGDKLDDVIALESYASDLPHSSKAFLKAAIRKVTSGALLRAKARATPQNIGEIQSAVYRIEAVNETIKVKQGKGTAANIWLDKEQVSQLMATCLDDLEGTRDWIVLAMLVGAGLRREELAGLEYSALVTLPSKRNKKRVVLDVKGKGSKERQIPISEVLAKRLQAWKIQTGDGRITRAIGRKKEITNSLSPIGIFEIVQKHGALIEVPELAPHDLRRTYAQLGYEAGIPITQISRLLGHASVKTTQTYLNLELDLDTTISDFIPL
jgi:integrase